jgi:elongation factor P
MATTTNDLKNGMVLDMDGKLVQVVEFQHVKPGKGPAFVRTKIRNVRTGAVVEKTFRAGEKVERVTIDNREMQYLYRDGDDYVFMDNESYEQIHVGAAALGDTAKFLIDGAAVQLRLHGDEIVGSELPASVELAVAQTEPGIQGDRVSGATKPATLETGHTLQVPLFVNIGDKLKVDTRSGEYITRA